MGLAVGLAAVGLAVGHACEAHRWALAPCCRALLSSLDHSIFWQHLR